MKHNRELIPISIRESLFKKQPKEDSAVIHDLETERFLKSFKHEQADQERLNALLLQVTAEATK